MNPEKTLERMVTAARNALLLSRVMDKFGYGETPYFSLYGDVADAIYYFIGEKTETFDESVTSTVLENDGYTLSQRVDLLLKEYEKNKTS